MFQLDLLPVDQYKKLFGNLKLEIGSIKTKVLRLEQENILLEDANNQLLNEMVLNRDAQNAHIQKLQASVDQLMERLKRGSIQQGTEVQREVVQQPGGTSSSMRSGKEVRFAANDAAVQQVDDLEEDGTEDLSGSFSKKNIPGNGGLRVTFRTFGVDGFY